MNTLKTTMSKIAQIEQPERTELAKHEVELALVDDLKKLASLSENQLKTNKNLQTVLVGMADSINNKLKEIDAVNNQNDDLLKNAENLHNNFKKLAQDLGIDYKNTEANKIYESILKNALLMNAKKTVIDSIKTLIR
jgi:F0F1-type ATP synthase membrane subunit b/b'